MTLCIVLKDHPGWRKGDHIEVFGDRLQELISRGIVQEKETEKKDDTVYYVRGPNGGFVKAVR